MIYTTFDVTFKKELTIICFNRDLEKNSISTLFIKELHQLIDHLETQAQMHIVLFEAKSEYFISGMDFTELTSQLNENHIPSGIEFWHLLERISQSKLLFIAKVNNKVSGGGLGLVAASDIVVCGPQSTFILPEALFGIVPAIIFPFLIQRIGIKKCVFLAATTRSITAEYALSIGLVDEYDNEIDELLRKLLIRLRYIDAQTIQTLKRYAQQLSPFIEQQKELALQTFQDMLKNKKILEKISNYSN